MWHGFPSFHLLNFLPLHISHHCYLQALISLCIFAVALSNKGLRFCGYAVVVAPRIAVVFRRAFGTRAFFLCQFAFIAFQKRRKANRKDFRSVSLLPPFLIVPYGDYYSVSPPVCRDHVIKLAKRKFILEDDVHEIRALAGNELGRCANKAISIDLYPLWAGTIPVSKNVKIKTSIVFFSFWNHAIALQWFVCRAEGRRYVRNSCNDN